MTAVILDFRPAAARATAVSTKAATELARLFGLDQIAHVRRRLVCHWRRGPEGHLIAVWEADIAPAPTTDNSKRS